MSLNWYSSSEFQPGQSTFCTENMWFPCSYPYRYLGRILVHITHWCPSLEEYTTSTSINYCSVQICTPSGGERDSIFLLLSKHTKFSVSSCVAASDVGIFCKAASNNNKSSLPLSIWAFNPLSLACHFLCVHFSHILVLQVDGDTLKLSVFAARQID